MATPRDKIERAINRYGSGMTPKEVADKTKVGYDNVRQLLRRMAKDGSVLCRDGYYYPRGHYRNGSDRSPFGQQFDAKMQIEDEERHAGYEVRRFLARLKNEHYDVATIFQAMMGETLERMVEWNGDKFVETQLAFFNSTAAAKIAEYHEEYWSHSDNEEENVI
jgi:hypothetical protein